MGDGHKRSLTSCYDTLAQMGVDVPLLKERIDDIIIKTIIAGQPHLAHLYRTSQPDDLENSMCFEILG